MYNFPQHRVVIHGERNFHYTNNFTIPIIHASFDEATIDMKELYVADIVAKNVYRANIIKTGNDANKKPLVITNIYVIFQSKMNAYIFDEQETIQGYTEQQPD